MIISDDIIMEIIQHYTREAGVRELERYIAKLCRKTVLAILKEKVESVIIDQDKLVEFLGKAPFDHTKKLPRPQVGVVTGMAYTQFGGDILPIEVNHLYSLLLLIRCFTVLLYFLFLNCIINFSECVSV